MAPEPNVHRKDLQGNGNNTNVSTVWAFVALVTLAVIIYFHESLADPLYRAMVFLFHPDMARGVFWGSLLVTFVASVMGKDQQQRLDQGKFGLAAGTSLGGLSGLIEKQPNLLVVGFVGSAVGGLLGWLFYLVLASFVVQTPKLKSLVIFQTGGLEELHKQLNLQSKEMLRDGFKSWTDRFSRMMADAQARLVMRRGSAGWEDEATNVIRGWLTTAVDTLALVFGTLADKPQYQSRVTVIVYRVGIAGGDPSAKGMHWISYADGLKPHVKDDLFDERSVGYKVMMQKLESPYFTTKDIAQKDGQTRAGDPSYRPFITFRLNHSAILALDWPEELKEEDDYVRSARSLFNSVVTPGITELLNLWPRDLADAAGVPSLQLKSLPAEPNGETRHQTTSLVGVVPNVGQATGIPDGRTNLTKEIGKTAEPAFAGQDNSEVEPFSDK